MNTGETTYITNLLLMLDIEAELSSYNTHKITDLCITDIFGNTILRVDELNAEHIKDVAYITNGKLVIAFDSQQDCNFISRDCERLLLSAPEIRWFCGKRFFEGVLNINNLSLKKVCDLNKLKYPKHNAKDDCLALARALRKVIRKMPETYTQAYVDLVLAVLQASKEVGMDNLPLGDNLPLDVLIREIEDRTSLGESYLELFRNKALDELTSRGAFATNVDILKRGDSDNNVT